MKNILMILSSRFLRSDRPLRTASALHPRLALQGLLLALFLAGSQARLSASTDVWFTYAPETVGSGTEYYVEAVCEVMDVVPYCDITIYKNSQWFAHEDNYPDDPYNGLAYAGGNTTDYGAQTVEYCAEGYNWYSSQFAYAYAWVTIN